VPYNDILFLEVKNKRRLYKDWNVKVVGISFVSMNKVQINAFEEVTVDPVSRQSAFVLVVWTGKLSF